MVFLIPFHQSDANVKVLLLYLHILRVCGVWGDFGHFLVRDHRFPAEMLSRSCRGLAYGIHCCIIPVLIAFNTFKYWQGVASKELAIQRGSGYGNA